MGEYLVVFYVAYPYYFPHFLPIANELKKRGHKSHFILSDKQNISLMKKISKDNGIEFSFGEERLFEIDCDFVFFANPYKRAKELNAHTIFLEHGIGTKSTKFYPIIEYIDTYLVEGNYKYNRLSELYPHFKNKLSMVGFSKFDAIVNITDREKHSIYKKYNLDPSKKTILYAPTFFPSSIEKMSNNFPDDFKECNIIVKAHYLTYERKRYKNQRKKLDYWKNFDNCFVLDVEEYDLIPLFNISDVMISDESSAMFEFVSLNKPVISNRFFKLRLSYYLMPWKLKNRIDSKKDRYRKLFSNAYSYNEMVNLTKEALMDPDKLKKYRLEFSKEICGKIDGKVSKRVVDLLEDINV